MRIVITGVNGFVGQHLVRELVDHGHTVTGIGLGPATGDTSHLLHAYVAADLRDRWPAVDCDAIVHLAGLSQVGPSFEAPQWYIEANSAPVTHLGEALLTGSGDVRVLIVSTGAVCKGARGIRWDEDAPTDPSSPYIVSKLVTEAQSAYYRNRGLDFVVMRPFNHVGPGQKSGFLLPDLVHGVEQWKRTRLPLTVGNLDTRRDYTDVRDVVRAYRLAVEAPYVKSNVFNVCSGDSISGHELLTLVTDLLTPGDPPEFKIADDKLRPGDPVDIRGDNSRIHSELDWQPSVPITRSVHDFVTCRV